MSFQTILCLLYSFFICEEFHVGCELLSNNKKIK